MSFLRRLRDNHLTYLFILFLAVWIFTGLGVGAGFVVWHQRVPVSNSEVLNWLMGNTP